MKWGRRDMHKIIEREIYPWVENSETNKSGNHE